VPLRYYTNEAEYGFVISGGRGFAPILPPPLMLLHEGSRAAWLGGPGKGRSLMFRTVFAVAVIALCAGAAIAQQDPIAARRALMKANGDQAKIGASMMKGETPFDLDKARKIFAAFEEVATKVPSLLPENSKTGGDTAADPKIWQNMDDVKARFAKFGADAKDALAKVSDLDSFKAAFGAIGKNDCGGCHEKYRIKKS
jgi:cytochrome c556